MPRPISLELVARGRRADPVWHQVVEAHVLETNTDGTPREHIRSTRAHWAEADGGAGAVDAIFTRYDNGDLKLKDTTNTLLTLATSNTHVTSLDRIAPFDVLMCEWKGTEPGDFELLRVKLWLNPRINTSQKREVVKWRCELMFPARATTSLQQVVQYDFAQLCDAVDVDVVGDTAGLVTFDFSGLPIRPRPKSVRTEIVHTDPGFPSGTPLAGATFIFVYALTADGSPAANAGIGFDTTVASVTSAGNVLSGRRLTNATGAFGYAKLLDGGGSPSGTPRCTIENGTFAATQTITFSTNPFNAGATPTGDLELTGHIATPKGTSVTLEIRNDADSAYVAFTDGQLHSDIGIGKTQPRKMRATLNSDPSLTLTPTLKKLGLRAVTRKDGTGICEVRAYEEAFDPQELRTEIPDGRLVAIKNGPRDFRSWIEDLLATNYRKDILLRSWIAAPGLPRSQWMHKTDFGVGDWEGHDDHVAIRGLSPLGKLKDAVPPYSPGTNHAPDGTQSIGSWTDLAGGTTNIHTHIDEASADETDGIRSGTSPSNQQVVFTLPTPTDVAGRRMFVDCDYSKDASGGEQIDLKIQLAQGGNLVAELVKTDIGPDRMQSTMELSEAQIAALTNLTDIRLAFTANAPTPGTGRRAQVYWARFRTGGRREVVTYTNVTLKAACDDIVDNRLALDKRYRGQLIESTAHTVSKQLTGLRKRNPDGKEVVAKTELEALAYLAGGIIHELGGRLVFTSVFETKPITAIFPSERIRMPSAGPGLARRRPEFFIGFQWDREKEEFKNEGHYFHGPSLDKLGRDTLGPPPWLNEEVGKWVDTEALADVLGLRMISAFGCGEMLWPFFSIDRYPEIHIGDLIAVETDKFVARDPNLARELRGIQWVIGIIQRADFWGENFTIWPRGYADILGSFDAANRLGFHRPEILAVQAYADFGAHVFAVVATRTAGSIRLASSLSAMPSDATARAATPQAVDANGTFTTAKLEDGVHGQTAYIKVFAYERADGTGAESRAGAYTVVIGQRSTSTGDNPQGSIPPSAIGANFITGSGGGAVNNEMWIALSWPTKTIYRVDGSSVAIPSSTAAAPTPTLSQMAGGALGARTYFVRIAYGKGDNGMYAISAEASFAVSANFLLKVTSPASVAGFTKYWVLIGTATNAEYIDGNLVSGSGVTFGTDYTEATSGRVQFGGTYNSAWLNAAMRIPDLAASATHHHYPYYDIPSSRVLFGPNSAGNIANSGSDEIASRNQGLDGHIPLSAGSVKFVTPSVSGSNSDTGGGTGAGGGGVEEPN